MAKKLRPGEIKVQGRYSRVSLFPDRDDPIPGRPVEPIRCCMTAATPEYFTVEQTREFARALASDRRRDGGGRGARVMKRVHADRDEHRSHEPDPEQWCCDRFLERLGRDEADESNSGSDERVEGPRK